MANNDKTHSPSDNPQASHGGGDNPFGDLDRMLDEQPAGGGDFPAEKTGVHATEGAGGEALRKGSEEDIDVLDASEVSEVLDVLDVTSDGSAGAGGLPPAAEPTMVTGASGGSANDGSSEDRTVVVPAQGGPEGAAGAAPATFPERKTGRFSVAGEGAMPPAIPAEPRKTGRLSVGEASEPPPTPPPFRKTGRPGTLGVEAKPEKAPSPPPSEEAPAEVPRRPLTGDPLMDDNAAFRREMQQLARTRNWKRLAELTSAAVERAPWAELPEAQSALLIDLARVYRDRLSDSVRAEQAFRRLAEMDPGNADAIDFLSAAYRGRGEWRALYDLYSMAIEPTWDPEQRLAWTREMVEIATDRLNDIDLAITAWERLWRLGDAIEETFKALSEVYRRARRWEGLASFLGQRASQLKGAERIVALREVAEAYLSGLRDQGRAATVIAQILEERPEDLVALLARARLLSRSGDWEALADLGAAELKGQPEAAVLDFRRLVADALWAGGEMERAVAVYERVLELRPDDAEASRARDEYLEKSGKYEVLVNLLAQRADRATDDQTRAALLERAALLAEKELEDPRLAISLWEKRVALDGSNAASDGTAAKRAEAYDSLANLYESLGDPQGVARALEGQLALTRHPATRVELLRRFGEHAAHRMGDDAKAEACWKEIVSLLPDDAAAQAELVSLHRRRGDFEALDRALQQQAWRALDEQTVLSLWHSAAQNCDENIAEPRRAIAAWLRVIDLSPQDGRGLAALTRHRRTLGQVHDLVAALESELRATEDAAQRVALGLEVANLWEGAEAPAAAVAAYERVLRWEAGNPTALKALERLRGGADRGVAVGALEVAATVAPEERIPLLRRALAAATQGAGGDEALAKFHGLRRILWLNRGSPEVLNEVEQAAAACGAWSSLAALYEVLAGQATDAQVRAGHQRALARLAEEHLKNPVRALLALEACGRERIGDPEVVASIERLCEATGRHEDALALADAAARAEVSDEVRRTALRRRLSLCETRLGDGERAFFEAVRLLFLDPSDTAALGDARRLAEQHGLWRALDALYAELWDLAGDTTARLTIARARHGIRAERLNDPVGALDQLMVMYRLQPEEPGLLDSMLGAAEALGAWDRVLPLVEAQVRARGSAAVPEELMRVAALNEEKRSDAHRAFELYAEALVLRPAAAELQERLERLAGSTGRWEHLALYYRFAAARAGDPMRQLELYHRITDIYATRLGSQGGEAGTAEATGRQEALDVHRRILQLQPAALPSLDVVIDRHRTASEWRELRDRLLQWTERAPAAGHAAADLVPRWVEIARLSRSQLGDPESALTAFARILEIDQGHEEALQGVRSLTEGPRDPALELRRLRIELERAQPARRIEIHLEMARIQETQFDDADGAIKTLRALVEEAGAASPGYEPLARLYRSRGEWGSLVDLMEARARALPDQAERLTALAEAVRVCDAHVDAVAERRERLYRHVLSLQPDDIETRRSLLALYRDGKRGEDMAALLRDWLTVVPQSEAEERLNIERELTRVLDRGLGRLAEAEVVLKPRTDDADSTDADALLAQASLRLRQGDFAGYLALRQRQARQLPPAMASLVLCHLAEACDETQGFQAQVAALYREARTLDAGNLAAQEALKAIGRRAKGWRASAALLPDADEGKLDWAQRAERLRQHAEQASDAAARTNWLQRAVAVEPDHYPAWDLLAQTYAQQGNHDEALAARRDALDAFVRSTPPESARLAEHAERIQQLALAYRAVGDEEQADRLALQAHQLLPDLPSAALAVAEQRLAAGDQRGAFALYNRVLERGGRLSNAERLHATFQRGAMRAQLGEPDRAITDLRAALEIDALHPGALRGLADVLAARGCVGAAIQHYIQALLVVSDASARGQLFAGLGRLWEDAFRNTDEAGVCYDLAVEAGLDDRDLMVRALRHYRRGGQSARALAVIDRLLPATQEAADQAMLWTERGGILAASDEQQGMEAFDMALSYDPGNLEALKGLSQILERRGDWEQLVQIHEARTETGTPLERAEALRSLARVVIAQLGDRVRAERYLIAASELAPTRADFEQLLELYGDAPEHLRGRKAALGGLLSLGGPWMPRLVDLGRMLAHEGERRWAWCLLSPLMSATITDQTLKALVLELRKEFEKQDSTTALHPDLLSEVRHPSLDEAVLDVVAELDGTITLGRGTPEEWSATGLSRLDERTAVGKVFASLGSRLGVEGVQLSRVQELELPYVVLDGNEPPHVLVRAELLQLLSQAETGFLFASMIGLARPGSRLLASLPPAERELLLPALAAAVGLCEPTAASAALCQRIREGVPAERREAWAAVLRERLNLGAGDVQAQLREHGGRLWNGLQETARRVGTVAAADLRFVARVLTRLDESLPKMPTVGKIEDVEAFFEGVPTLQSLIGFAASPLFGNILSGDNPQVTPNK